MSMLDKWAKWYKGLKEEDMGSFRYGNTETYQLAEDFLKGLAVEDWGCGAGGFKKVHQGQYFGVDGTKTPFVDKLVDLAHYRSPSEAIMMRHVLEHNYLWPVILNNALQSFAQKFCLIIFTPFQDQTREIAHNLKHGVDVPDIGFQKEALERFLEGFNWRMETRKTGTHYGVEHIYYIER